MFGLLGIDKVAAEIIGIVAGIILIVGIYFYWKHSIKTEALLEWNKAQQEQVAKEQKKLIENLTVINRNQEQLLAEIQAQNQALEKKFGDLESYLNRPDTVKQYKNKGSSDVLRRTFKELNK